ncbi:SRPBCC family protein [Sphingosinicella sp. BN140058]|uniref:SRPBCC family protein n=1 Tax=Sphingosinicella sp. BN140058 TaxID=1892855 RepID=UPI0010104A23|nr:SRPBCC family protein [Sphingosinicella sp. BN140058]QAY75191.1 SRPBCC family protein [Sphingosinicella sp. BN140058]
MADLITARTLRFQRELAAPIDTVWRYLIDPELRARWFMGGPTEARVGGPIGMTMAHDNLSDEPVPFPERYAPYNGRSWSETITRMEPPHLLAFTWDNGDNGEVVIELSAAGDGRTRLTLTHSGIRSPAEARNFGGGWGAHLAVLEKRLAGEHVASFWTLHADAEARAARAIGD